jgi:hypothetical protein
MNLIFRLVLVARERNLPKSFSQNTHNTSEFLR